MSRAARAVECLLGLFFIFSAATKAGNVSSFGVAISAYGVIKDPGLVLAAAYAAIAVEALLGAAFLGGWRLKGLAYLGATLLTVAFSGLILYGWRVNGLEDCGCFGEAIKMGPVASLTKNGVLLAVLIATWLGLREEDAIGGRAVQGSLWTKGLAVIGAAVIVGIYLTGNAPGDASTNVQVSADAVNKDIAFQFTAEGHQIDLAFGEHLVVFLNADCDHCRGSVPGLNAMVQSADLPPMVSFMMGTPDSLDDFILSTEPIFPIQLMNELTVMKYIQTAPPTLYFIREGMILQTWEWPGEPPAPEEVAADIPPVPTGALKSKSTE